MFDHQRNINPTPEARLAMIMWGEEYSRQHGGSMDFWDKLSAERKRRCEIAVEAMRLLMSPIRDSETGHE